MFRPALLALAVVSAGASLTARDWGYDYEKDTEEAIPYGPEFWYKAYPNCGLRIQSPIDIRNSKAERFSNSKMPNFVIEYVENGVVTGGFKEDVETTAFNGLQVENNGHFISLVGFTINNGVHISEGLWWNRDRNDQEDFDKAMDKGKDFDEPFNTLKYFLHHIDFHWGKSEHEINGGHKRAEMQMFFYRSDLSGEPGFACDTTNGCFIYSVLINRGSENDELKKITDVLSQVNMTETNQAVRRSSTLVDFNIDELFPSSAEKSYYHYVGSLTYPPCTQGIPIVVAKNYRKMKKSQLDALESLIGFNSVAGTNSAPMEDTYRENQERNARVVAKSFGGGLFGGSGGSGGGSFLG